MNEKFKFDLQTFAVASDTTGMAAMINPEVMADMISAALPKMIKFTQFAQINTTLEGQPGDTITVPKYKYIGDAKDFEEGEAIHIAKLETTTSKVKIKKAGLGVKLTDEAILSGYGDPVGEAVSQLGMSIASKVDEDIVTALNTTTLVLDKSTEAISYGGIVDAVDRFEEESDATKVLFIHPKQLTQIRKNPDFLDKNKYGGNMMVTGAIGSICGCEIVVSRRVPEESNVFSNFLVQLTPAPEDGQPSRPAISLYLKRRAIVETDRDIITETNVITTNMHYVAHLSNEARVIKLKFKGATA